MRILEINGQAIAYCTDSDQNKADDKLKLWVELTYSHLGKPIWYNHSGYWQAEHIRPDTSSFKHNAVITSFQIRDLEEIK